MISLDVEEEAVLDKLRGIVLSFSNNAFCKTGKGGGVDPTCGTGVVKAGQTLVPAVRKGKVWMTGGKPAPPHIQKLGIPPAWNSVHVNPNPKGTILATGVDAKGRTQSKYSDTHTAKAAASKFGRVSELSKKRGEIFKELERDAKKPALKDRADCLKVIMQTGMRPGSEKDTGADHKSYGATTLEGRHVKTGASGTKLRLVTGKNKGRAVDFPIRDPSTAKMLQQRARAAGPTGKLFSTDATQLSKYSKDKDGKGFKTKDHRTALATEVALDQMKKMKAPRNGREYKKHLKKVATAVANQLGNTPAVALKSYIDPTVFTHWRNKAGAW